MHRIGGVRSKLIGRDRELAVLMQAINDLGRGQGTAIELRGEAGSGKSRLVDELKLSIQADDVAWREAYAYEYSQNIPYSIWRDFFNRLLGIEYVDTPGDVRTKLKAGIADIIGDDSDCVPYLGTFYALQYEETKDIDPGFLKGKLVEAVTHLLSTLNWKFRTVVYFEDLQWADPSSVELLTDVLPRLKYPAVFICVSRPEFRIQSVLPDEYASKHIKEVTLSRLDSVAERQMLPSLLDTENVPLSLADYVIENTDGNPFYIEEIINNLLEAHVLVRIDDQWDLTIALDETSVPSTIQGVISARLDRLPQETKRILQVASVIGNTFYHAVLQNIVINSDSLKGHLDVLQTSDLIRLRNLEPDLEYIFKHALMQAVVYESFLKKERRAYHELVGQVIEEQFPERLPEFYEELAYHYRQSGNLEKAFEYLAKSGKKSLARYAADEAHRYYQQAYDLIKGEEWPSQNEELLIALLIEWAYVFYFYGDLPKLYTLLSENREIADRIESTSNRSMYYAWLGEGSVFSIHISEARGYFQTALDLVTGPDCEKATSYAYCWLSWHERMFGEPLKGLECGNRALELSRQIDEDQYLIFKSMCGIAENYYCLGRPNDCMKYGEMALEYGMNHSNTRALVLAYISIGEAYQLKGDSAKAIEAYENSLGIAKDRFYAAYPKLFTAIAYLEVGRIDEALTAAGKAKRHLNNAIHIAEQYGLQSILARSLQSLGRPYLSKRRYSVAREKLELACDIFRETDANVFLRQTEELISSLPSK